MFNLRIVFFLFLSVAFISCNKNHDTSIDVSGQWKIDNLGQLILGLDDGQWQLKTYNSDELNLFASLDTTNLTGTSKPDSISLNRNYIFPNYFPSSYGTNLSFNFSNGYNGLIVLKLVVVDNKMNPVRKQVISVQGTSYPSIPLNPSYSGIILITPNLPVGKYRLYYTLSSQGSEHFFKTWGNIESK